MAGRGVFFFPRRDEAVAFFFRGGTGRLLFFSEAGRGGFFFFPTGRDGAVFFFFFRGPGRDGYFWRWQFFWRDGAKSLHRPAKGGLNRPASRPCKALFFFSKYGEEHVCNLRRFLERLTKSNLSRIYVYAKAQTEESQRQRRHPVAPSSSSYRRNSTGQVLSNRPLGPECLCHRNTPLKTSNIVGLKLGGLDNALGGLPNALGGLATTPRRCFVRGGGGGARKKMHSRCGELS